jgi:CheY-like chemotaxis protein
MVKYKNTRILVVDDEEFCISTMKSYLSQLGINVDSQVDFCINGEEAI